MATLDNGRMRLRFDDDAVRKLWLSSNDRLCIIDVSAVTDSHDTLWLGYTAWAERTCGIVCR
jgi:hypothetical protein